MNRRGVLRLAVAGCLLAVSAPRAEDQPKRVDIKNMSCETFLAQPDEVRPVIVACTATRAGGRTGLRGQRRQGVRHLGRAHRAPKASFRIRCCRPRRNVRQQRRRKVAPAGLPHGNARPGRPLLSWVSGGRSGRMERPNFGRAAFWRITLHRFGPRSLNEGLHRTGLADIRPRTLGAVVGPSPGLGEHSAWGPSPRQNRARWEALPIQPGTSAKSSSPGFRAGRCRTKAAALASARRLAADLLAAKAAT